MIYPAEMLADLEGADIIGVTFHPMVSVGFYNGSLQLNLGGTEATEFSKADGVIDTPITGLTNVATIVPAQGATKLEFLFDEPYKYEGGNLAVETLVAQSGGFGSTTFMGLTTENAPCFYEYEGSWGSGTEVVKFLPKMTIVYKKAAEEPVYYVVGGFNDWSQEEGMVEITEAGATITVEAQGPNDKNQEFKIITAAQDGGWIWYGGEDANGAGFFDLTGWLGSPITLNDSPAPTVQNFRLPDAGTYNIKLVADRDALEGLKMVVTKETVTAIETVKGEVKGDNDYYNLMGQKMNGNNLPAGIYIHNGKKVIVR